MTRAIFSPAIPIAPGAGLSTPFSGLVAQDLGLTSEAITITPTYYHKDVYTDSYGDQVPADVLCYLADCQINLKLIHYDDNVLGFYLRESVAGGNIFFGLPVLAGSVPAAGTPMGGGFPLYTSGNHYVGLTLFPSNPSPFSAGQAMWYFPATYMTGPPMVHRIGTEASITECKIRALPYRPLLLTGDSTGASGGGLSTGTPDPFSISVAVPEVNAPSAGSVLWFYNGKSPLAP